MLPRLTPLNTRPTISPVASRLSIARSDSSASARISLSGSTNSAPFFSRSGRSSVFVFGSRRLRQRADRAEPRRLVAARELHGRLGQRQQRLDLGILLLRKRALDHRQHVLVGAALQRLRRREARRAIRRDELQRRDRRGELAPHPVVEHDVVARFRQRVDLGAGRKIDGGAVLHAQHRLARGLHLAVQQRLQQRQRAGVAGGDERGDGLDLRLVLAEREIVHELRARAPARTARGAPRSTRARESRRRGERGRGIRSWLGRQ